MSRKKQSVTVIEVRIANLVPKFENSCFSGKFIPVSALEELLNQILDARYLILDI